MRLLKRSFFARDSREVAQDLLNKILLADAGPRGGGGVGGRIVETEAYLASGDAASHSFNGQTRRNASMFGKPGLLYVYFTYGMHWCANAVCGADGEGTAVLIRALAPIHGLETMAERRPKARRERDLCSGPARLCQALAVNGDDDDSDLLSGRIRIFDDGTPPPAEPGQSRRIGLSVGVERPWRWFVQGNRHLSRPG